MAKDTELLSIFSQTIKEINDAGQSDILKGSISSIKALQSVIQEQDKLIDKTLRAGDERAAMRILKAAKQAQEAQVEATNNLREAKEKLAKLDQEGNTKARDAQLKVVSRINQEINKLAREAKLMQKNAAEFGKSMEHGMTQYEQLLQNREERMKELGKAGALLEEKFSNRFEASVNAFTSGIGDLESFGDSFAGGLKSLGAYLKDRQGKAAERASQGKGSAGFARMLGTFSKVAATTAVVAGSVMMLVKLFNFVEGQVKEMNKEILQGHTGIELMAQSGKGMAESLDDARKALNDADFANALGVKRDEIGGLVNGLADANMNLKYFGGSFDRMKSSMKQLKGFGEGLGIGFEGASEYMEKFAVDMGVAAGEGAIIAKMEREFASIRDMALQSSYSTKNFFMQVKELTESLEGMNNRSEEAGMLFLRFAKIVGPKGVGAMLSGLAKGFKGDSWLDLIKRQMLTKGKDLGDALEVEANRTAKAFMDTYLGQLKSLDPSSEAGKMLVQLGLLKEKDGKLDASGMTPEALVKAMRGLKPDDRQKLLGALSITEGAEGAGRALGDLSDAARGTGKGASSTDKSRAMKRTTGSAAMAVQYAALANFMKKKNIKDASGITLEAAKEFGLSSQEEIDQFGELQERLKGQLMIAQDMVKDGVTDAERKKIEEMGLRVVENAKTGKLELMMADQDKKVDSVVDMIMAQGGKIEDEYGGMEEHQMTTEDYLAQQVNETMAISDKINNHIGGILMTMSDYLFGILNWTREDDEARGTRQKVYDTIRDEQNKERENLRTAGRNLSGYDRQTELEKRSLMGSDEYKKASRGRKRAMIEEFNTRRSKGREGIEASQKQSRDRLKLLGEASRNLSSEKVQIDYTGWGQYNAEETLKMAESEAAKSMARRGDTSLLSEQTKEALAAEAKALEGTGIKSYLELYNKIKDGSLTDKQKLALAKKGFIAFSNAQAVIASEESKQQMVSAGQVKANIQKVAQSGGFKAIAYASGMTDEQKHAERLRMLSKGSGYKRDSVYHSGMDGGIHIMGPDGKPLFGNIGRGKEGERSIGVTKESLGDVAAYDLKVDRFGKAQEGRNLATAGHSASARLGVYARDEKADNTLVADKATLAKTLDQLAQNTEPQTEADLRKRAQEDAKAAQSINVDTTKDGVLQALKKHKEEERKKMIEDVAKALGIGVNGRSVDQLSGLIAATHRGGLKDAQTQRLQALGLTNSVASSLLGGGGAGLASVGPATPGPNGPKGPLKPVDVKGDKKDFWEDSRGDIWSIDSKDLPTPLPNGGVMMTKPGGPVNDLLEKAFRGGGGGGIVVNMTVNGAENPEETARKVVRRIKESTELRTGGTR